MNEAAEDLLLAPRVSGIYLDHQATERPRPRAIAAVATFMGEHFGNPSALTHGRGQHSRRHLEHFRKSVASLLGQGGGSLLFTSGATESNNLVIGSEGSVEGAHLVVSAVEHKCVLESALRARSLGARVSILPVDARGVVDLDALRKRVAEGATLVSVMAANNEIGSVQPIQDIADICRRAGARFHTDAAQAVGKIDIDYSRLGADYLTLTAHKYGGPQGIGGVLCSAGALDRIRPLLVGGGQERGLRAGTTPLALCAGMAAASLEVKQGMAIEIERMRVLRNRLLNGLRAVGPYFLNSDETRGLCNNLNGGFDGVPAAALIQRAPRVHFSAGSACTSGASDASHVLTAIGLSPERIASSFRLSVGWSTTEDDIDEALTVFEDALQSLRSRSAIIL